MNTIYKDYLGPQFVLLSGLARRRVESNAPLLGGITCSDDGGDARTNSAASAIMACGHVAHPSCHISDARITCRYGGMVDPEDVMGYEEALPVGGATNVKRGKGARRKTVSIESIYVADQGIPGYRHVPTDRLPAQKFHTAGGAVRSVLKAMKSNVAPAALEVFFVLRTDTGAGFRVHVNCEHDDVTVAHQGHSDMANDFLDDVGRETGWPNVAIAVHDLQQAVEDGRLFGDALKERVRSEFIPGLRQWGDCIRQRDEWDESELERVARSIERSTGLDTVTDGAEPNPLNDVINVILQADDPVAAVLDEAVLVELDYMDIPVALDPLTNKDLKMGYVGEDPGPRPSGANGEAAD